MMKKVKKSNSLSRRNFVTKLTAGTAGALLSVDAAANAFDFPNSTNMASGKPKNKKVKIGVVGGGFGANFYWHEHPDCIVTGVTDLEPKRRKKLRDTYKCNKVYDSMEEMLCKAKDIDAVAIFTEAPNHARHSIYALNAGKHVVCAVPAAMTLQESQDLVDTVKRTGLVYMMAETSYWQQTTIAVRNFYKQGKFGNLINVDSMYQHDGLEAYFYRNGKRTWRYGLPPMQYPTHCTTHYVGVTGDRLSEVSCIGWGDNSQYLKDNDYNNPYNNETAMFKTGTGLSFNVRIWWNGAFRGAERAEWIGDKMSLYGETPNGMKPTMVTRGVKEEKDDGGFSRRLNEIVDYQVPKYYLTDMLPKPLRHANYHGHSHTFITHEFIDSIVNNHKPAVDVYEALAFTVPGIVAHKSALRGGEILKIPDFGRGEK